MKQISWCPVVYDVSEEIQAAFERSTREINKAERAVRVTDQQLTAALAAGAWASLASQGCVEFRIGSR